MYDYYKRKIKTWPFNSKSNSTYNSDSFNFCFTINKVSSHMLSDIDLEISCQTLLNKFSFYDYKEWVNHK